MTQLGEGYSPPEIEREEEDPKDKKPLTIRIVLMCDGTNNNRNNIAEREKFELNNDTESPAHKKFGTKGSSYDNGRTNIATMEPHIKDGENIGGYSYVVKVYVQGQGTFNFEKDHTSGLALGSFGSGVYQRAREGINDALQRLNDKLFETHPPSKHFIKQVDIDVFGFSRGAATARHAIHVLTEEEILFTTHPSGYGTHQTILNRPLFDRLRFDYGFSEITQDKVNIIFAGLYDTVVSVNASQLMPAWIANNTRDQKAVAKAKFALQLAAADEHRQDFPLHRITSATSAGTGAEYFLPGVHSDIGGSYNLANDALLEDGKEKSNATIRELKGEGSYSDMQKLEKTLVELGHQTQLEKTSWNKRGPRRTPTKARVYTCRQISGLEYSRPSDEVEHIINRGRVSDLQQDMKNLKADGWYEQGEMRIDIDYLSSAMRATNIVGMLLDGSPKSGELVVNRSGIGSAYCTLPLKFMLEHSRKYAIASDTKLDRRIGIILESVPQFASLEQALRTYMAQKGPMGSKSNDWNDITQAEKIYPGIKQLRHEQLHMSSQFKIPIMDPGFTPRLKGNLRRRFYYEG